MFLTDTNVLSELRKGDRADEGVHEFFTNTDERDIHLSVVTVAELRLGVLALRHKRDERQRRYAQNILIVDKEISELWARLRVPNREPAFDKHIAATAIDRGLTVVTRNVRDFEIVGVSILNPFE